MSEFPPDLIGRCGRAAAQVWSSENKGADISQSGLLFEPTALAVLRESGHAELVAALKDAHPYVADMPTAESDALRDRIAYALRKAGAL